MASSIYDRSRTFFSLRGHGCNGAFEPDYGVEEVSAAVKNPVCKLTLQLYTPASRPIASCTMESWPLSSDHSYCGIQVQWTRTY